MSWSPRWVRLLFLRSGQATRWDLLKTVIFTSLFAALWSVLAYGRNFVMVIAVVVLVCALAAACFALARNENGGSIR